MMTGLMGLMLAAAVLAPGGAPDMRVDAKGLSMGEKMDAFVEHFNTFQQLAQM